MVRKINLSNNCSIIIPCIKFNSEVKKCINECLKQKKINVKIFVVSDFKLNKKINSKKIKYLNYGKIHMSEKRNKAVSLSKDKYIAFIDSDAYPTKEWIYNAIKLLKKNSKIHMVTGPDLPFPNQKGWSYDIGLAHKSFLLSGSKVFRKNIKGETFVSQASSCNMVLRKNIYQKVGGMNQKIYIGEDIDLCDKFSKYGKIIYSPFVKIFHKSRDLIPFIKQRYAYGTCIDHIFSRGVFLNNIQYLVPLFITLYIFLLPLFQLFDQLKYLYNLSFIIFNLIIFFEVIRISLNPIRIIKVFFIVYLGFILFGLGSLFKFLGLTKNIKQIYTSHNKNI